MVEDIIILLNPKYEHLFNELCEYLEGLGFKVINHNFIIFTHQQAKRLISTRYKNSSYKDEIIEHFSETKSAYFHISKLNAYKEIDKIMRKYFTKWPEVLEFKLIEKPLKISDFPLIFIPMD